MNDSKTAYQEALKFVNAKCSNLQGVSSTDRELFLVPNEVVNRITCNFYRVLYCVNIYWDKRLWNEMLHEDIKR